MPRMSPISGEEQNARRAELHRKAVSGELRMPAAFREIRTALGMTQAEFARRFRLTRIQVIALENGKANPTLKTMDRIGRVFGFRVGFVGRDPDEEPGRIVR